MMPKDDHNLVQQVLAGSLSHEGFKAFQWRLRREPELVVLYRQYALLHHSLSEEFEGRRVPRKPLAHSRMPAVMAGLAVAASIILLAVLLWREPLGTREPGEPLGAQGPRGSQGLPQPAPMVAEVTFSEDAVWSIRGEQHAVGQTVRLSRGAVIRLGQGQARLTLKSGAAAVIDGNTVLEFMGDEALRLSHGRGRFRVVQPGRKLAVTTPTLTAVDLGTEFGLLSVPGHPDEVHVLEGRVEVRLPRATTGPVLKAGEAARVIERKRIERIPLTMPRFPQTPPRFVNILADNFESVAGTSATLARRKPQQGAGLWEVARGQPVIDGGLLEGGDFEVFFKLPENCLSEQAPILLATLRTTEPQHGQFHTTGWAGMSFYQAGSELLFFGDAFGEDMTWGIDVGPGLPAMLPEQPVIGPRTVTLYYNRNTGAASLHEGSLPLGSAFVRGTLPAGIEFDEIRLSASPEAVLALRSLSVLTGESAD